MLMIHAHDKIRQQTNSLTNQAGEFKNKNAILNRNTDLTWLSTCEMKPGKLD